MISKRASLLLSIVVLLVLAGCGGGYAEVSESVDGSSVVRMMQYGDSLDRGPQYNVSMDLPSDLAGQLVTQNAGNILKFDYINERERTVPLFRLEALSEAQYWKQIGGYPGQVRTLRNTGDTVFIASMPIDSFYSGMDEDTYAGMVDSITEALSTVSIERVN